MGEDDGNADLHNSMYYGVVYVYRAYIGYGMLLLVLEKEDGGVSFRVFLCSVFCYRLIMPFY